MFDAIDDSPVETGLLHALFERSHDDRLIRFLRYAAADNLERAVQREVGRDDSEPAVVRQALRLSVQVSSVGIDAIGVSKGILIRRDGLTAVEKVGVVDERSAELIHDIGRVAVADVGIEDDGVAEWELETRIGKFVTRKRYRGVQIGRHAQV